MALKNVLRSVVLVYLPMLLATFALSQSNRFPMTARGDASCLQTHSCQLNPEEVTQRFVKQMTAGAPKVIPISGKEIMHHDQKLDLAAVLHPYWSLFGAPEPPSPPQTIPMVSNYSGSSNISSLDNMQYCPTVNCLDPVPNSAGVQVTMSNDKVLLLTGSGCVKLYSDPLRGGNGSWTQQPGGCGVVKPQYNRYGDFWALYPDTCDGVHYKMEYFNGTSWVWPADHPCGNDLSFDPKGGAMSVVIGAEQAVWVSLNDWTSGKVQLQGCSGNGGAKSVAMLNSSVKTFMLICNDNTVWKATWSGSGSGATYQKISGLGVKVAASASGVVYIIGTDGKLYRWKGTFSSNDWTGILSSNITNLAIGGPYDVWAISGGSTVRMSEIGLVHKRTLQGSTQCIGGPCPNAIHTGRVQARWQDHAKLITGQLASASLCPSCSMFIQSVAPLVMPFECFADPTGCSTDAPVEDVQCNISTCCMNDATTTNLTFHFDSGVKVGSFKALSVSRYPVNLAGWYLYTIGDNCNPYPAIITVANSNNQMLDAQKSDVSMRVDAWCFSLDGLNWTCPGYTNPNLTKWEEGSITMHNPPIPDPYCSY